MSQNQKPKKKTGQPTKKGQPVKKGTKKKKRVQQQEVQHVSKTMNFFQQLQKWMFIGTLCLVVYVVFFMPTGQGNAPTVNGGEAGEQQTQAEEFNMYKYLNNVKSGAGTLTFNCEFDFNNGDVLKIESSKKFETRGSTSSILGSTIYNMNDNAAVFDDYTYISEGNRYEKNASGYVKSESIDLNAGNLNLGKIEDEMTKEDKLVKEDGVACYRYYTTFSYGDTSNELRNFIRAQNVNVADINNLMLEISMYVTENGVPYKFKVEFTDAKCMVKANTLQEKNCTVSGELVIAISSFNGVSTISLPAELSNASEGAYTFTDKLNRYMSNTSHS